MTRQTIHTDNAPAAIGPYSQAVRVGNTVFFSGQIPLEPATGAVVGDDIETQVVRAFENLKAVAEAAGGSLDKIVRLGLFLTDLSQFSKVNEVMQRLQRRFPDMRPSKTTIPASWIGLC